MRWRQLVGEGGEANFVLRVAKCGSKLEVAAVASRVASTAWKSEFQVEGAAAIEFTTLHRIEDWATCSTHLPTRDPSSVWRRDLERDLIADQLICTIRRGLRAATRAAVIQQYDAEAFVRLIQTMLRRPRL